MKKPIVITERVLEAMQAGANRLVDNANHLRQEIKSGEMSPDMIDLLEKAIENDFQQADILNGFIKRYENEQV